MKCSCSQMLMCHKLFITVNNLETELLGPKDMYAFLTFDSISQCPPERWLFYILVERFSA